MSKKDVETIMESLLTSRESLEDYERYHNVSLSSHDKEAILSQIGFCSACRHW